MCFFLPAPVVVITSIIGFGFYCTNGFQGFSRHFATGELEHSLKSKQNLPLCFSMCFFFFFSLFFLAGIYPGKHQLRTILCFHPASHSHLWDVHCNYSPFLCSPSTAVGAPLTCLDFAKRPRDLNRRSSSQKNVSTGFCSPVSHETLAVFGNNCFFSTTSYDKISWAKQTYSSATNSKQCQSKNFSQPNMADST